VADGSAGRNAERAAGLAKFSDELAIGSNRIARDGQLLVTQLAIGGSGRLHGLVGVDVVLSELSPSSGLRDEIFMTSPLSDLRCDVPDGDLPQVVELVVAPRICWSLDIFDRFYR
jgi:hypothetical protein